MQRLSQIICQIWIPRETLPQRRSCDSSCFPAQQLGCIGPVNPPPWFRGPRSEIFRIWGKLRVVWGGPVTPPWFRRIWVGRGFYWTYIPWWYQGFIFRKSQIPDSGFYFSQNFSYFGMFLHCKFAKVPKILQNFRALRAGFYFSQISNLKFPIRGFIFRKSQI